LARIAAIGCAVLLVAAGAAAQTFPNDPYFTAPDWLSWHHAAIFSQAAWAYSTGSAAIRVAVLDAGVYAAHPDLAGGVLPGYSVYGDGSDTSASTVHGTAVAGIVAARLNNGIGTAGMGNFQIVPVKITNSDGAFSANTINGLNWVADHAAELNIRVLVDDYYMSPSTIDFAGPYAEALARVRGAGVLAVGSLENNGVPTNERTPNMLMVGGSDHNDALRPGGLTPNDLGSNWGPAVDLVAPSVDIYTTYYDPTHTNNWEYARALAGNSWAAPQVAGAAALLWSINPQLSVDQVESMLLSSARDLGAPGRDDVYGYGLLDAGAAAAMAAATVPLPEPSAAAAVLSGLAAWWLAGRLRKKRWQSCQSQEGGMHSPPATRRITKTRKGENTK
jgi:hypothetical protein